MAAVAAIEYDTVLASEASGINARMNALASEGWDIFAVTNGYHGAEISPPGVTLWLRRPKQAAAETIAAIADQQKPKATDRLAEARRNRRP